MSIQGGQNYLCEQLLLEQLKRALIRWVKALSFSALLLTFCPLAHKIHSYDTFII